ncbi:MAG TPA: type II toxin-antitoxin system HipA family toxin [Candidatus Elarobacter sp.]|nr:type II toxin-antitoxin system HipA family toxin [Candidatus Elarobacter sp.]
MTSVLRVSLAFSPEAIVPVGRLALERNVAVFEYDGTFAATGLSVNPVFGPVRPGLLRPRDPRAFRGLHGVFADSLPDAWGELLVGRRLRHAGVVVSSLTVLDRLALVGRRGRGALVYEPAQGDDTSAGKLDLDRLAGEAVEVMDGHESAVLRELERLGGSSGGARPKVQVALDDMGQARTDDDTHAPGFTSWIVKFRGSVDRADIGPLEAAYAEAARRAGIDMPRTRLIASSSGPGYFATERFDRAPDGRRLHMLSVAGMLDADWTVPAIDYETLLGAVRGATHDEGAVLQMYRRMVFNVLALNRDDHTKQHALLLDRNGVWRLSPAYDLTFAYGPGNEHYLTVNRRGREITRRDLLAVAETQTISRRRADGVIAEVAEVVGQLPAIARDFGITQATFAELREATTRQLALTAAV